MKNLSFLVILTISLFVSHYGIAQVKVTSTGKTILGLERSGNDPSAQVTTEALGINPSDALRTKSRISFGDYSSAGSGE